jgi:hypothetical protein
VSLEPPAWLRTGKPPNPPGLGPAEARVQPLVADVAREPVNAKAERAIPPAEAPVIAQAAPSSPVARDASPSSDRAAPPPPPKRSWFGVTQAAPIEERSEPPPSPVRAAEPPAPPEDYATQARRMLADAVPRLALQAEPEVARVLWLASADDPLQDRIVADAARAIRVPGDGVLGGCTASAREARRLNNEARAAAGSRRGVDEAFDLQLRAFGANPRDPEVAGNLALLHLKLAPPQPDRARQLALLALAARCPQFAARLEDWNTFAVASALSGREADATRALFVTLALGGDGEARCVAALNTLSSYGERMRGPVEAMFYRMRSQGRGNYSPACAWPATWTARRLP